MLVNLMDYRQYLTTFFLGHWPDKAGQMKHQWENRNNQKSAI